MRLWAGSEEDVEWQKREKQRLLAAHAREWVSRRLSSADAAAPRTLRSFFVVGLIAASVGLGIELGIGWGLFFGGVLLAATCWFFVRGSWISSAGGADFG